MGGCFCASETVCTGSMRLVYNSIDVCTLPAANIAISRRHFKCCGKGLELLMCVFVYKRGGGREGERETEEKRETEMLSSGNMSYVHQESSSH